jgi:segregation and condensation protein B
MSETTAHAESGGRGPPLGRLAREAAALLFCSPQPVPREDLCDALRSSDDELDSALAELEADFAAGRHGIVLRQVAGGYTLASDPETEEAVRRLLAKPRTPPLSQAQAECLAVTAYLKRVSRPEIARIRGVNSESPMATLEERGLIEEAGRSRFGAILYRTTPLFQKLFGLEGLADLPPIEGFEPSDEEAQALRDKLLRAGEQRIS